MGRGSKQHSQPSTKLPVAPKANVPLAAVGGGEDKTSSGKAASGTNAFTWPIVIVIVVVVAYVWQTRMAVSPLENLNNVEIDTLKQSIFGNKPYLFYCDRTQRGEKIPASFENLRRQYHPKIGFATVNCSQQVVLATEENPVAVTMWDKFKLKREWRPAVFAVAPWMKLRQIPPDVIEGKGSGAGGLSKTLQKFVDVEMRPMATHVVADNDYLRHCGFSSGKAGAAPKNSSTCIILIKGAKYGAAQEDIEAKLATKFLKTKFARVSGATTSFNFDKQLAKTLHGDSGSGGRGKDGKKKGPSLPHHSEYALRVVAIRDGQYYLPMTYSPTWNYIDTFVSHAINAPTEDFTGYNLPAPAASTSDDVDSDATAAATTTTATPDRSPTIHMYKKGSGFKARRSAPVQDNSNSGSSSSSSTNSAAEEAETLARIEEVRKRREEKKREQRERELQRAEAMQKESINRLFEEDEEGEEQGEAQDSGAVTDGDDDDDEDEESDGGYEGEQEEEILEL